VRRRHVYLTIDQGPDTHVGFIVTTSAISAGTMHAQVCQALGVPQKQLASSWRPFRKGGELKNRTRDGHVVTTRRFPIITAADVGQLLAKPDPTEVMRQSPQGAHR
jgi:hypothetical protein